MKPNASKGKSRLTNVRNLCSKMLSLTDEERAVDIIFVDLSKAFDTVPHQVFIDKLLKYGLGGQAVGWTENWLGPEGSGQWGNV